MAQPTYTTMLLLPCDSYTEANESYLVSWEQSHVLTNKDTVKVGLIGKLGFLISNRK